jgi:hypothetical protein
VIKTLKDLRPGHHSPSGRQGLVPGQDAVEQAHHRVGFFYNRDIVGGGIFNNESSTPSWSSPSKGRRLGWPRVHHGQLHPQEMPIHLWDALDVVNDHPGNQAEKLPTPPARWRSWTWCSGPAYHSYRLDFEPASSDVQEEPKPTATST